MVFNIPILKNKPKRRIRNQQITTEAKSSPDFKVQRQWDPHYLLLKVCTRFKKLKSIFSIFSLSADDVKFPSSLGILPHPLEDDIIYGWPLISCRTISMIYYKGTLESQFQVDSSP